MQMHDTKQLIEGITSDLGGWPLKLAYETEKFVR